MKISQKLEYACRALAQLAKTYDGKSLTRLEELAQREAISANFLVQILNDLRRGGMIDSRRGASGGYLLSRPANQITLRQIVEANPQHGPVYLLKIDIADGFYRIWLNANDIPTLAVSIPLLSGTTPLLALPLVLPMGWTESPPLLHHGYGNRRRRSQQPATEPLDPSSAPVGEAC